jgi:hypothetical protein
MMIQVELPDDLALDCYCVTLACKHYRGKRHGKE